MLVCLSSNYTTTNKTATSGESIDILGQMDGSHRNKRLKKTENHTGCNGTSSSRINGSSTDCEDKQDEPVSEDLVEDHVEEIDPDGNEEGEQVEDEEEDGEEDDSEYIDGEEEEDEDDEGSNENGDDDDEDDVEGDEEEDENENSEPAADNGLFDNPEVIPDESAAPDPQSKRVKFDKPKLFKNARNQSKRLIVILEKANLEIIKIGKKFELLNCDDHMSQIRKYRKDPAFCRPDIVHQCLLMLFDSPLNRAGLLQVYVHTMNNILIEINPQTRLPRTFPRFAGMMVQLLYNMSIKSNVPGVDKLLRVIKNPVTSHLPVGVRKIGMSFKAERIIHPSELIPDPESNDPLVVVIGAMAHGDIAADYVEESVSISNYPLSGALACTKVVSAFEQAWNIH